MPLFRANPFQPLSSLVGRIDFGVLREHCPFPHLRRARQAAAADAAADHDPVASIGAVLLTDFSLAKTFTAAGAAWVSVPEPLLPDSLPLESFLAGMRSALLERAARRTAGRNDARGEVRGDAARGAQRESAAGETSAPPR